MESQLSILSESLDKKLQVLQKIREYNAKQEQAFLKEEAGVDSFDESIAEKDQLIEELTRLDDGFETLYEGISKELQGNREQYAGQIKDLQDKITKVMDLSVAIQAQEARNKKLVEEYFAKARKGIRQSRQSSKAAYDYYKTMSASTARQAQAQFMDSKQ